MFGGPRCARCRKRREGGETGSGEFAYEIVDGDVIQRDQRTGKAVRRHAPVGSRVVQVLELGEAVVVREEYYRFPRGESNVYCLDRQFELRWTAELPDPTDTYANPVTLGDGTLLCASWNGYSCTLDERTGRLLEKTFTK